MPSTRQKPRNLDRREFTLEAALAMLSGVVITISGCKSGASNPQEPTGNVSPTPAPTPTPSPTATPEAPPDPRPHPTESPSSPSSPPSPSPTPTPSPSPSPKPSPTPSPSPTPAPTPSPTPGPITDEVGAISSNHGHLALVTAAQQRAGGAIVLDIRGAATHTHTVQLSSADVGSIADGTRVSRSSSTTDGHKHTVTFN